MDDKNAQRIGAAPDPAKDLIARAREAEPCAPALPGQAGDCAQDAWFEAAFAALPSGVFDPVVLAAVDLLMRDSESVTATARQRLVDGAERGIRWRGRLGGQQLEHLLRDRRHALGLSPRAVAARIGVGAGLSRGSKQAPRRSKPCPRTGWPHGSGWWAWTPAPRSPRFSAHGIPAEPRPPHTVTRWQDLPARLLTRSASHPVCPESHART